MLGQLIRNTNMELNRKFETPNVGRKAQHSQAIHLLSEDINRSEIKQNLGIQFSSSKPIRSLRKPELPSQIPSYKLTSKFELKSPSMSVPKQRNLRDQNGREDFRESRSINSSYANVSNMNKYQINTGDINDLRPREKRTISQIYTHKSKFPTLEPNTPTVRDARFELPDLSRRSERKKRQLPISSAERKLPE